MAGELNLGESFQTTWDRVLIGLRIWSLRAGEQGCFGVDEPNFEY